MSSLRQGAGLLRVKRVVVLLKAVADGFEASSLGEKAGCAPACAAVASFLTNFSRHFQQSQPSSRPSEANEEVRLCHTDILSRCRL